MTPGVFLWATLTLFGTVAILLLITPFARWLFNHPAHTVCKQLPESKTEPCKHERFVMDEQIRVIECKQCGMRSWLEKDHVDLFPPKKRKP